MNKNSIKYPVKLSNDYILSKHDLSAASQQMVIEVASKIQKDEYTENLVNDAVIKLYTKDLQEGFGTDHRNLKRIFKRLREESVDVPTSWNEKGEPLTFRNTGLILRTDYKIDDGWFEIHVDEKIKPHFIEFSNYLYTIGNKKEFTNLSKKHSKRLYFILRKIQFQKIWRVVYELPELNKIFKTNYSRFGELDRSVLKISINEINEETSLKVHYEGRKSKGSRAIDQVVFDVEFTDVPKNLEKKLSKEDYIKKQVEKG